MSTFDWESFLRRWSQELIRAMGDEQADLPPEALESGWLGYPGATEEQINQAEAHLGMILPPSYRAFLKVTNGWRQTTPLIDRLWSTEEIEWFASRHQDWIDAFLEQNQERYSPVSENHLDANTHLTAPSVSDEEYLVYGEEQDCSKLRVEYLQAALEISDVGESAIYLLNPQVVADDGEWEAWFFGDWLPGADRYPSFRAMMQAEYENFLELREQNSSRVAESNAAAPLPTASNEDTTENNSIAAAIPPLSVSPEEDTVERPHIFPVEEMLWRSLARFTIKFQTRQIADQIEKRIVAYDPEGEHSRTWSALETEQIRQWMLAQVSQGEEPAFELDRRTDVSPVKLEIVRLWAFQPPSNGAPIVLQQAGRSFPGVIRSNEPFVLEILFRQTGQTAEDVRLQHITYQVQAYFRNYSTGSTTSLGDIPPNTFAVNQHSYIATFPGTTLLPGIYRLRVLATLQGIRATPGYFETPMLQVI
ncbi:MAG: SMI1/KNR4 family protein [Leptolyngbyaceae cyanobacterium MO_188.B28]|nr:SMI1/KNR4 family protein [Leptolyngbyaceae cyanobacterium MO_188.B28]